MKLQVFFAIPASSNPAPIPELQKLKLHSRNIIDHSNNRGYEKPIRVKPFLSVRR